MRSLPSFNFATICACIFISSFLSLNAFAQSGQPLSVTNSFKTYKKGKLVEKESGTMTMTFGDDKYAITTNMDKQPMTVIFDSEKRTMTTIVTSDEGEKVASIMPLMRVGDRFAKPYDGQLTKTGNSKQLLGRTAFEYIMDDDGEKQTFWVADMPEIRWQELVSALTGASAAQAQAMVPSLEEVPNGFPLASTTTRKGGKVVVESAVTQLNVGSDADLSHLSIPADATVQDMTAILKF